MKKMVLACIAIVLSFLLISCTLPDDGHDMDGINQDNETAFHDDLYTSREGTLENGRKYVFYGTDENDFNFKDYMERMHLSAYMVYDVKIKEETTEGILEKVQGLSGWHFPLDVESTGIAARYDSELEALVFEKIFYGEPMPGGFSVVAVNCKDGSTTLYTDRSV